MSDQTVRSIRRLARITFGVGLCLAFLAILAVKARRVPYAQAQNKPNSVPVIVTQLEGRNGLQPLEVKCSPAKLSDANQLTGFSCALKNHTIKNITGVCLTYTILIEGKGRETVKDARSWVIETLIHPDFKDISTPIAPEMETTMNAAAISFEDAIPKSIEISVDYVEFEDGETLGPDLTGSKIIADMKSGAGLYKAWLVREHVKGGKSQERLAALIQNDQRALPDDPELPKSNVNQEQGAKAYRTLIRRLLNLKGPEGVMRHFPR